jgi:hypothetical protein
MVDMGQADSSLYAKPLKDVHAMSWTRALVHAARRMGFDHYMDVPDCRDSELRALARDIQLKGV